MFSGLATVVFVSVLRMRTGRPRLPLWALALIAIAAAFVIPWALALAAEPWRAAPALPALPTVTFDQVFIGALVALAVLTVGHRPNMRPRVPLWAGLSPAWRRNRAAAADRMDGRYQRPSLRADVNHCTRGMKGRSSRAKSPIFAMSRSRSAFACPAKPTRTLCANRDHPARRGALRPVKPPVVLPSNPGGLTVVACRPPDRPSRMKTTIGPRL